MKRMVAVLIACLGILFGPMMARGRLLGLQFLHEPASMTATFRTATDVTQFALTGEDSSEVAKQVLPVKDKPRHRSYAAALILGSWSLVVRSESFDSTLLEVHLPLLTVHPTSLDRSPPRIGSFRIL